MKKDIIGKEYSLTFTVQSDMTATLDGTEIHPVCSTVTMVYYAELAARKAIEPFFETGDQAIGGGINLKHTGMAALGENIEVNARIISFDGRILVCEIESTVNNGEIILCKGTQTQVVLQQEIITGLIEKAYARLHS
ncbi:MAG: thioesterase family protein [Ignavibacteria bacterium]